MSDIINSEDLKKFSFTTDPFDVVKVPDHLAFRYQTKEGQKKTQDFQPLVSETNSPPQAPVEQPDPMEAVRAEEYQRLVELSDRLSRQIDELQARAAESEQKEQEAYERGLADGERNRGETEDKLIEQYAFGLERLQLLGKSMESLARQEALEIALLIARRILQTEINMQPMLLVDEVKRVTAEVMGKKELTLRLNPEDLLAIKERNPDLAGVFPAVAQVSLKEDETLERGDCIIDTEVEQINLSLDEQLKAIKQALEEELK